MTQNLQHGVIQTKLYSKLFPDLLSLNATSDELRLLANLMRDPAPRLPAADKRNYSGLTYFGHKRK